MKSILDYFRKPTPRELALEERTAMQRQLLSTQRHKEYYEAQERALLKGIERITNSLDKGVTNATP